MDTGKVHDFRSVPACPVEMVIKSRYFMCSGHHSECGHMTGCQRVREREREGSKEEENEAEQEGERDE